MISRFIDEIIMNISGSIKQLVEYPNILMQQNTTTMNILLVSVVKKNSGLTSLIHYVESRWLKYL
jgi:hypothetical protein